ncbi:MAG: glycosyltransferase family 9 protein [Alphaproteobacteria bacterium]|nr:glycosyltransferase family 9 protein [Alphaproteobacteria bacterium]
MRVLFITSTRIGDAVLSTGLLSHLIDANPGLSVTIACGAVAAPLFEAVPGLDRIIVLSKRALGLHWWALWCVAMWRVWDLVVDLRGSILAYFLPHRARIVFRGDTRQIPRVAQLAAAAGLAATPAPRLWTLSRHDDVAARLVPPGAPVLAFGPTANWHGKEWPIENFVTLLARLTNERGLLPRVRIAVLGAATERKTAEPLLAAIDPARRLDLIGRSDLLTSFAALKRCALFIGNDSGLMHMAAAAGVPTLGLFGPSRETHYAPFGTLTAVVRTPESYDALIGQPGYNHRTTDTLMRGLSVDAVESAARALWFKVHPEAP